MNKLHNDLMKFIRLEIRRERERERVRRECVRGRD